MGKFLKIIVKKKVECTYGEIGISNENPLLLLPEGCRVSPLLGEKLVYIGQLDSYEKGSEIAEKLLGLEVSDSKIYRLSTKVGARAVEWEGEEDGLRTDQTEELVYGQMDGSMILTREDSWKEVKLGRIFSASALYEENEHRNWLKESRYVAHLGHHTEFENKMSRILDTYSDIEENLVFIKDGDRWQWNWITAEYPKATQILDFYHALEHIGQFVSLLKSGKEKTELISELSECLKVEGASICWQKIEFLECRTKTQKSEKQKLKTYFDNNLHRMDYPSFLKRNLLIGSGAIESAHRTVIQRRMKLSGQRWSKIGAKNMLAIRTLNMSGNWNRGVNFFKYAA